MQLMNQSKVIAGVLLLLFPITNLGLAGHPVEVISAGERFADVSRGLTLPEELGKIKIQRPGAHNKPFVIFLQDAHAIVSAQVQTQHLIDYFQKNYSVDLVAVEGAAGSLDPVLFRSFPEKKANQKVLSDYLNRGELSGAGVAAILNEKESRYEGIENWALYERNYFAYLDALKSQAQVLEALRARKKQWDRERQKAYSKPLNELREKIQAFREERIEFYDFLKYLSAHPKAQAASESGSELSSFLALLKRIHEFPQDRIEFSIRSLAGKVKREYLPTFSRKAAATFNQFYQTLMTGQIDPLHFVSQLSALSREEKFSLPLSREMKGWLETYQEIQMMRGLNLFEELDAYLTQLSQSLIQTQDEARLEASYQKMDSLERLARLEMSQDAYQAFISNRQVYENILENPQMLQPMVLFYQIACQRDQALYENFKKALNLKAKTAIVIAGGFHEAGISKKLHDEGYGYAVVTPRIDDLRGEEMYENLMAGKISYRKDLKNSFYESFMKNWFKKINQELRGPRSGETLKTWRDEIIKTLARTGKLEGAGRYLRVIDEMIQESLKRGEMPLKVRDRESLLKMIEQKLFAFRDQILSQLSQPYALMHAANLALASDAKPSAQFMQIFRSEIGSEQPAKVSPALTAQYRSEVRAKGDTKTRFEKALKDLASIVGGSDAAGNERDRFQYKLADIASDADENELLSLFKMIVNAIDDMSKKSDRKKAAYFIEKLSRTLIVMAAKISERKLPEMEKGLLHVLKEINLMELKELWDTQQLPLEEIDISLAIVLLREFKIEDFGDVDNLKRENFQEYLWDHNFLRDLTDLLSVSSAEKLPPDKRDETESLFPKDPSNILRVKEILADQDLSRDEMKERFRKLMEFILADFERNQKAQDRLPKSQTPESENDLWLKGGGRSEVRAKNARERFENQLDRLTSGLIRMANSDQARWFEVVVEAQQKLKRLALKLNPQDLDWAARQLTRILKIIRGNWYTRDHGIRKEITDVLALVLLSQTGFRSHSSKSLRDVLVRLTSIVDKADDDSPTLFTLDENNLLKTKEILNDREIPDQEAITRLNGLAKLILVDYKRNKKSENQASNQPDTKTDEKKSGEELWFGGTSKQDQARSEVRATGDRRKVQFKKALKDLASVQGDFEAAKNERGRLQAKLADILLHAGKNEWFSLFKMTVKAVDDMGKASDREKTTYFIAALRFILVDMARYMPKRKLPEMGKGLLHILMEIRGGWVFQDITRLEIAIALARVLLREFRIVDYQEEYSFDDDFIGNLRDVLGVSSVTKLPRDKATDETESLFPKDPNNILKVKEILQNQDLSRGDMGERFQKLEQLLLADFERNQKAQNEIPKPQTPEAEDDLWLKGKERSEAWAKIVRERFKNQLDRLTRDVIRRLDQNGLWIGGGEVGNALNELTRLVLKLDPKDLDWAAHLLTGLLEITKGWGNHGSNFRIKVEIAYVWARVLLRQTGFRSPTDQSLVSALVDLVKTFDEDDDDFPTLFTLDENNLLKIKEILNDREIPDQEAITRLNGLAELILVDYKRNKKAETQAGKQPDTKADEKKSDEELWLGGTSEQDQARSEVRAKGSRKARFEKLLKKLDSIKGIGYTPVDMRKHESVKSELKKIAEGASKSERFDLFNMALSAYERLIKRDYYIRETILLNFPFLEIAQEVPPKKLFDMEKRLLHILGEMKGFIGTDPVHPRWSILEWLRIILVKEANRNVLELDEDDFLQSVSHSLVDLLIVTDADARLLDKKDEEERLFPKDPNNLLKVREILQNRDLTRDEMRERFRKLREFILADFERNQKAQDRLPKSQAPESENDLWLKGGGRSEVRVKGARERFENQLDRLSRLAAELMNKQWPRRGQAVAIESLESTALKLNPEDLDWAAHLLMRFLKFIKGKGEYLFIDTIRRDIAMALARVLLRQTGFRSPKKESIVHTLAYLIANIDESDANTPTLFTLNENNLLKTKEILNDREILDQEAITRLNQLANLILADYKRNKKAETQAGKQPDTKADEKKSDEELWFRGTPEQDQARSEVRTAESLSAKIAELEKTILDEAKKRKIETQVDSFLKQASSRLDKKKLLERIEALKEQMQKRFKPDENFSEFITSLQFLLALRFAETTPLGVKTDKVQKMILRYDSDQYLLYSMEQSSQVHAVFQGLNLDEIQNETVKSFARKFQALSQVYSYFHSHQIIVGWEVPEFIVNAVIKEDFPIVELLTSIDPNKSFIDLIENWALNVELYYGAKNQEIYALRDIAHLYLNHWSDQADAARTYFIGVDFEKILKENSENSKARQLAVQSARNMRDLLSIRLLGANESWSELFNITEKGIPNIQVELTHPESKEAPRQEDILHGMAEIARNSGGKFKKIVGELIRGKYKTLVNYDVERFKLIGVIIGYTGSDGFDRIPFTALQSRYGLKAGSKEEGRLLAMIAAIARTAKEGTAELIEEIFERYHHLSGEGPAGLGQLNQLLQAFNYFVRMVNFHADFEKLVLSGEIGKVNNEAYFVSLRDLKKTLEIVKKNVSIGMDLKEAIKRAAIRRYYNRLSENDRGPVRELLAKNHLIHERDLLQYDYEITGFQNKSREIKINQKEKAGPPRYVKTEVRPGEYRMVLTKDGESAPQLFLNINLDKALEGVDPKIILNSTTRRSLAKVLEAMELASDKRFNPVLEFGVTAGGKSTIASLAAKVLNTGYTRIQINEKTDEFDLFGAFQPYEIQIGLAAAIRRLEEALEGEDDAALEDVLSRLRTGREGLFWQEFFTEEERQAILSGDEDEPEDAGSNALTRQRKAIAKRIQSKVKNRLEAAKKLFWLEEA